MSWVYNLVNGTLVASSFSATSARDGIDQRYLQDILSSKDIDTTLQPSISFQYILLKVTPFNTPTPNSLCEIFLEANPLPLSSGTISFRPLTGITTLQLFSVNPVEKRNEVNFKFLPDDIATQYTITLFEGT